jgi:dihydroorotate dehydrogenase (fumarate)
MADLQTTYMGIPLRTPIVVAASTISSYVDRVKMAEQAGAGALVIRSLFEEQIQFDRLRMEEALAVGEHSYAEATSYFPKLEHGGASEHLMWIEKTRKAVRLPLIASLNAVSAGGWAQYARQLSGAGVDGIELNVYTVAADPRKPGAEIEQELLQTVESVRAETKLPLAVKLSPFYTSIAHLAAELDRRGVNALVIFNRFLQPDIDPDGESLHSEMSFSTPAELRLPLRWAALLHGRIRADLAVTTGVHSGRDAAKALLAGATVVQVASALLQNGIPYLSTMLRELEGWMGEHGYSRLEDFRGKLSQKRAQDPFLFDRAQYVNLLLGQK